MEQLPLLQPSQGAAGEQNEADKSMNIVVPVMMPGGGEIAMDPSRRGRVRCNF